MDITKEIERQTQELQKKLALLSDNNLQELVTKKAALETELADIEAKISNTCKLLGGLWIRSATGTRGKQANTPGGVRWPALGPGMSGGLLIMSGSRGRFDRL
jgi:hypothetical protein